MDEVINLIDYIQNSVFNYDIKELNDNINKFIEELCKKLPELQSNNVLEINEIMKYLNDALFNKDYLLYADILKYEFLHFVKNN